MFTGLGRGKVEPAGCCFTAAVSAVFAAAAVAVAVARCPFNKISQAKNQAGQQASKHSDGGHKNVVKPPK